MKITIVVIAHNEEKNIEACLKSVKDLADEIILIDSSSTDNTAALAKQNGTKVIPRENNPMLNVNKNFGFEKAAGDWILSLDADERVSEDLVNEIKRVVNDSSAQNSSAVAYKIPRKNIIFGQWIEHTGWYPDYQTRLFKKGKAKFAAKHNHEQITVDGEVGTLENNLLHDHYKTLDEFLKKTFFYTKNEAEEKIANGYKFKVEDLIKSPFQEFLSRYFARSGYKDGTHGLALSLLMSFYHLVIILRVWEKEKFVKGEADTRKILRVSSANMRKDIKDWDFEIDAKTMSEPKKIVAKIKKKFQS